MVNKVTWKFAVISIVGLYGCIGCVTTTPPLPKPVVVVPVVIPDGPPVPPKFVAITSSSKKSMSVSTNWNMTTRALVVAPPSCLECPVLHSLTNYISAFTHRPVVEFYVSNMFVGHAYIVQKSSNLKSWDFISGWMWWDSDRNADQYVNYNANINPFLFFRCIDQGTNQPPTPVSNK